MMKPQNILLFLVLIFSFTWGSHIYGQASQEIKNIEEKLRDAEDLMKSFQNDPAIQILSELEEKLSELELLNAPIGLRVQDKFAEALEKDHKDELAIEKLLVLARESENQKLWDVFTNSQLSLARLFEKIGRDDKCISHLRKAGSLIKKHDINKLRPRYNIRISSYHRLFAEKDSAIYYAQESIRFSEELGLINDKGTGHLLMGLLTFKDSYKEATFHFEEAGKIWLESGDHAGYSFVHNNLSRLHYDNGKTELAMVHNDFTLVAAQRAIEMGHDYNPILYTSYHFRSKLYEDLGRLDSALFYQDKAYRLELEEAIKSNEQKILEIDGKYNDELKTQTIRDQQMLLESDKKIKTLFLALFIGFLLFSILLVYNYVKLLSTSKKVKEQSLTISSTNQELTKSLKQSKTLQAELHHRVKNNLQLIVSLLELQSEEVEDIQVKDQLEGMSQRIHSMAATHNIFNINNFEGVLPVSEFIDVICDNFKLSTQLNQPLEITSYIQNLVLSIDILMPLGMILHELMTNSIKYFQDKTKKISIHIELKPEGDYIELTYKDNGPGFCHGKMQERPGGLGTYLMSSMIRQLDGHWNSKNDNGAVVSIYIKESMD